MRIGCGYSPPRRLSLIGGYVPEHDERIAELYAKMRKFDEELTAGIRPPLTVPKK